MILYQFKLLICVFFCTQSVSDRLPREFMANGYESEFRPLVHIWVSSQHGRCFIRMKMINGWQLIACNRIHTKPQWPSLASSYRLKLCSAVTVCLSFVCGGDGSRTPPLPHTSIYGRHVMTVNQIALSLNTLATSNRFAFARDLKAVTPRRVPLSLYRSDLLPSSMRALCWYLDRCAVTTEASINLGQVR